MAFDTKTKSPSPVKGPLEQAARADKQEAQSPPIELGNVSDYKELLNRTVELDASVESALFSLDGGKERRMRRHENRHGGPGGFVEETASVAESASITKNALVLGASVISGIASVRDYARVIDSNISDATIYHEVIVDNSRVSGRSATLSGEACVLDSEISGKVDASCDQIYRSKLSGGEGLGIKLSGEVKVIDSELSGDFELHDHTRLDHSRLYGRGVLSENVTISYTENLSWDLSLSGNEKVDKGLRAPLPKQIAREKPQPGRIDRNAFSRR